MKHIKVNFPRTEENFFTGNGEGMWVEVEDSIAEKYDNNESNIMFYGTLANDSVYYRDLKVGARVLFELRGTNRPVALIKGFLENYKAVSDDELEKIKHDIFIYNLMRGYL